MANPLQYDNTDFTTSGGVVDPEQLRQEFAAATFSSTPVVFSHINTSGVGVTLAVDVYFDTDPDATDTTAADAIIAAHTATGPTPEAPSGTDDPVDKIRARFTVGKGGRVDFTSIKDAIDEAISMGAAASDWYFIEVFPGTYVEDPMTVPTGVWVGGQSAGVSVDGVFCTPTTPASSLFTLTGGIVTGINAKGVTGSGEACFKTTSTTTVNACTACSADTCTNGYMADSGATLVLANCTAVITGLAQEITESIFRADNGGRILIDGSLGSAPAALLPGYSVNPIERVAWATNGSLISMVTTYFSIAPKDANQVGLFSDSGSLVVCTGTTVDGMQTAMEVGSGGSGSRIVVQGSSLRNNTTDFSIQSSTGNISASCSVDHDPVTDIVAGGTLSGTILNAVDGQVVTRGLAEYRYETGRALDVGKAYFDDASTGQVSGGVVTDGGGLSVDVTAGTGWVRRGTEEDVTDVSWSAETALSLTASSTNYVYYDGVGLTGVVASTSVPSADNILLAIVVTDGSGVRFIHKASIPADNSVNRFHQYLLDTRKFAAVSGMVVSQGTGATKLDVTSGSYYRGLGLVSYAGTGGDATWSYFYGTNGATEVTSVTDLNTTQYDNAGSLTSMTAGYFRADTVILTADGRLSVVYGTEEFDSQAGAEAAGTGQIPTFMEESGITLALVVVEQGVGIASILDARPTPDATAGGGGGGGGASDHGDLTGLGDDDHTQYLLVTGTRSMGGNLNMGTNNITNVGTVDGVDVSSHGTRHNPGAADPVTTAAAVAASVGQANAEGVAGTLARSDHTHAHAAGTPVNVKVGANAEGAATTFARSNHEHGIDTAAASIGIGAGNSTGSAATVSRSDHGHALRTTDGGGTDLTIGAIVNGQFLRRVGTVISSADAGDISGPGPSVNDNAIVRWNGTGALDIQNSNVILDDGENMTGLDTVTFGSSMETDVQSGANLTIDLTENQKKRITLTANITAITITAPPGIGNFMVEFIQDSTPRTLSGWPASVRWALEQGTPTMPQGSGNVLLVGMFYNGTVYRAHWATYAS